jgi:uncharacterized protein YdaU (DUF1376 family)
MPIRVGDLITDTQELTDTEFGAYVRLLFHHWKKDSIPADPARLGMIAPTAPAVWDSLKDYFEPHPDDPKRLINKNCLEAKDNVKDMTRKNRRSAWCRWHPGEPFPEDLANFADECASGDASA